MHDTSQEPSEKRMIDYAELIHMQPWILERSKNAVLSPDADGLLCGLLLSKFLDWNVAGFYDGKVMLLKSGLSARDCVFIDMEIFRKDMKSLGHHMVMHDVKNKPEMWDNFSSCINPNNIRGHDFKHDFKRKYPFGTIHFLLGILGSRMDIEIKTSAICPLLYADGTFKNMFNYPENCLSWLDFLGAEKGDSALNAIFYNEHYAVHSLMEALNAFFGKLYALNDGKKGADKIKAFAKN